MCGISRVSLSEHTLGRRWERGGGREDEIGKRFRKKK